MGYVEITRPDGTKTLLGEVPVMICQMCNEMPHFDETVRIVSIAPIQWQCEKCHAVNGQSAQKAQRHANAESRGAMVETMVPSS